MTCILNYNLLIFFFGQAKIFTKRKLRSMDAKIVQSDSDIQRAFENVDKSLQAICNLLELKYESIEDISSSPDDTKNSSYTISPSTDDTIKFIYDTSKRTVARNKLKNHLRKTRISISSKKPPNSIEMHYTTNRWFPLVNPTQLYVFQENGVAVFNRTSDYWDRQHPVYMFSLRDAKAHTNGFRITCNTRWGTVTDTFIPLGKESFDVIDSALKNTNPV